jgi:hypothetical protein
MAWGAQHAAFRRGGPHREAWAGSDRACGGLKNGAWGHARLSDTQRVILSGVAWHDAVLAEPPRGFPPRRARASCPA